MRRTPWGGEGGWRIGALARSFTALGLSVGFITNDQAANLVDTATVARLGMRVGEVAGGCFCCKFAELLDAAQNVLKSSPDVLLCEPVGSCTDMAATVLNPLRLLYRSVFELAPFTVLVDPDEAVAAGLGEVPERFRAEVGYIFRKQLEEADLVALNKTDTLPPRETARIADALAGRYQRPVVQLSALRGDGIEEWAQRLLASRPASVRPLAEIDYDTYASGEAVLGWLNMTVQLRSAAGFEAQQLANRLISMLRDAAAERGEIAHVKLALAEGETFVRANVVRSHDEPSVSGPSGVRLQVATLMLNARVQMAPALLRAIAVQSVQKAADAEGAEATITSLQSFSPGYPRPPYRIADPVP